MTAPRLAHLIKMPPKPYVHSTATDISKTIRAERKRLAAQAEKPTTRKVAVLKKRGER